MFLRSIFIFLLFFPGMAWAQEKPHVVATFSILGDMVRNVGGDKVEVTVLVGPNGDPHTFEPSPQENIALLKTQVIFENGLHFEHWLDKLYEASESKAARVVVTEGIEPIEVQEDGRTETDPHVWHDVSNAMLMVERIRDGLVAADGANAAYYRERTESYLAQLAALDHWVIDTLKDLGDQQRKLVTSHDTFGYFAKRYGFKVIGAGVESATTEAADPSAAQMAHLVEQVRAAGVKTAFIENTRNPKLMQAIAAEAGLKLAPALYTDALGPAGSDGDTYIKMMEHNVKVFAEALK